MAIKLMTEDGISMEGHYPKHVKQYMDAEVDIAVTIGDRAEAETGKFRDGTIRVHWDIKDPADADGTPDSEKIFRRTRQEIIGKFPELLKISDKLKSKSGKR
jgi:protein-tyrosine-phosphatase